MQYTDITLTVRHAPEYRGHPRSGPSSAQTDCHLNATGALISSLIASTLGCSLLVTGHSLGRNKLASILSAGKMSRAEVEMQYRIGRRIEAEERALDYADAVICSTEQEVLQQCVHRPTPAGRFRALTPRLAGMLSGGRFTQVSTLLCSMRWRALADSVVERCRA